MYETEGYCMLSYFACHFKIYFPMLPIKLVYLFKEKTTKTFQKKLFSMNPQNNLYSSLLSRLPHDAFNTVPVPTMPAMVEPAKPAAPTL